MRKSASAVTSSWRSVRYSEVVACWRSTSVRLASSRVRISGRTASSLAIVAAVASRVACARSRSWRRPDASPSNRARSASNSRRSSAARAGSAPSGTAKPAAPARAARSRAARNRAAASSLAVRSRSARASVVSNSSRTSPAATRCPSMTRMRRTTRCSGGWITLTRPEGTSVPCAGTTMSSSPTTPQIRPAAVAAITSQGRSHSSQGGGSSVTSRIGGGNRSCRLCSGIAVMLGLPPVAGAAGAPPGRPGWRAAGRSARRRRPAWRVAHPRPHARAPAPGCGRRDAARPAGGLR